MSPNEERLSSLVENANRSLQAIQDELGRDNDIRGRMRFPRGFIRSVATLLPSIPNIGTEVQRRNVCYALLMTDVLRWLAIRTDITSTALSMIVKEGICIMGAVCEWMTKEATRGYASRRSYKDRTKELVNHGIIDQQLKTELDWVWDVRCREHFHEVKDLEHEMYNRSHYNRALRVFGRLRDKLLTLFPA